MSISTTINNFIYNKDKEDPESYRKGRFFVISNLFFFVYCIVGEVWVALTGLGGTNALIGNGITTLAMIALFYVYKNYGKRILLVNILAVLGYMSNVGTFSFSGGIYSSDLVYGIVVSMWIFLVADKRSGIVWFSITFATILFFYFAEVAGLKDFKTDAITQTAIYPLFNFCFSCFFAAVIITLHENNKEKYQKELKESKRELELKSKELEAKNEDITSSINYAQKIQYAVLPHEESILRSIPLSFIFYRPKDIVSGDFYWFYEIDSDNYVLVCGDCTGHGVPGAFMTVIGSSLLNLIVIDNKVYEPGKVLLELDKQVNMMLKQDKQRVQGVQDGMDLSIMRVNKASKQVVFTSAKRPAIFIRSNELQEFKGSKFTIGGMVEGEKRFDEIKIDYKENDIIYFFTDGFTDQFGGEKGKKFSSKRLRELLLKIHQQPMHEQIRQVEHTFVNWKGDLEQIDDVCLMGVKF